MVEHKDHDPSKQYSSHHGSINNSSQNSIDWISIAGFILVSIIIFFGFYLISLSIDNLSLAVKDVGVKISNLKLNVDIPNTPSTPVTTQQPSKPQSITISGQKFSYIDTSLLDLSKAAGVKGNKDAKTTIVIFSDYQCPFCRKFWRETEKQLISEQVDSGKAVLYYFDYPLPYHQDAVPMSIAARCAGEQNKYWEMHNALNEFQDKKSTTSTVSVSSDEIKSIATSIGLDMTKFNNCFSSDRHNTAINEGAEIGQLVGIEGTPSIIVNGYLVPGAYPYAIIKELINKSS